MRQASRSERSYVIGLVSTLLLGVLILSSAVATAAHPARGLTYSGKIKRVFKGKIVYTDRISFKVSSNGREVAQFKLPQGYPVYCQGGGFGTTQNAKAKVKSSGTFKAKLPIYFEPTKDHEGFVNVTGKFGAKKSVSGTVMTDFTKSKTCNGTSKFAGTAK